MRRTVAICAWVLALTLPAPALASGGGDVRARSMASAGAAASYWTAERIARARPLGLVRAGGEGRLRALRAHPFPFTSGEVPDPTVFPNSTNGKLLGRLPAFGPFECSATVVDSGSGRVILTAGHCVFDPLIDRFAKRLTFIPAYTDGAEPLGRWRWTELETTRQWVRRGNSNFDFAAIVLGRRGDGAAVQDVAGGLPLLANGPREQIYHAVAYPQNRGDAQRMWACSSAYAGKDPHPVGAGKPAIAIGCDMTAGASGGGWMNDAGRLVSVSSFGYRARPGILYGPYLGVKAARLVARAGSR